MIKNLKISKRAKKLIVIDMSALIFDITCFNIFQSNVMTSRLQKRVHSFKEKSFFIEL